MSDTPEVTSSIPVGITTPLFFKYIRIFTRDHLLPLVLSNFLPYKKDFEHQTDWDQRPVNMLEGIKRHSQSLSQNLPP